MPNHSFIHCFITITGVDEIPKSWHGYLEDLEIDSDETDSDGETGWSTQPSKSHRNFMTSYRTRARIGRGGRMVMDRVPIYHQPNTNDNHKPTYIYPTYLSPPNVSKRIKETPKGSFIRICTHESAITHAYMYTYIYIYKCLRLYTCTFRSVGTIVVAERDQRHEGK